MSHRLRRWWQCLVVAGAVSYAQLQPLEDFDARAFDRHPHVWMLPSDPLSRVEAERIGNQVMTLPLDRIPSVNPN